MGLAAYVKRNFANGPGGGTPLNATNLGVMDTQLDELTKILLSGADLASATTIAPTSGFHKVTGSTTIDTITATAYSAGARIRLWFAAGTKIRHNGGGTGNIRTATGADRNVAIDEIVAFDYDGAVWREAPRAPRIFTSPLSSGPPSNPVDGDIWIATQVGTLARRWHFQYDAAESTALKWLFIGGVPIRAGNASGSNTLANTIQNIGGISVAIARQGHYLISVEAQPYAKTGWNIGIGVGINTSSYLKKRDFSVNSDLMGTTVVTVDTEFEVGTPLAAASNVYLNCDANSPANTSFGQGSLAVLPIRIA